jgi:hypothetical protein
VLGYEGPFLSPDCNRSFCHALAGCFQRAHGVADESLKAFLMPSRLPGGEGALERSVRRHPLPRLPGSRLLFRPVNTVMRDLWTPLGGFRFAHDTPIELCMDGIIV